ncbi:hypothetical protein [Mycoplasmopsis gallopavonis]|uniref:GIY-YIG domain-containing protein n=1 Tax=Mycoplasmopsis gallopavonis TaxID=76629 RepID=A0A449AZU4_9BACT|nr:hypothetical protein [Mycoplasmopsis gallopavonis]RIV16172.1 hypothetical protein D1113_03285 [Mycoplasmopsis gallopavonis]VEU73038.1 Uncharacterised protein [Mycoplasmopsis gallopavonis]
MKYIQKEHKTLKGVFKWTINGKVYIAKTNAKSGFSSRFTSHFTAIKQYLQEVAKKRNDFNAVFLHPSWSNKYLYTKIVSELLKINPDAKYMVDNFKDYIDIQILESSEELYDEKELQDLELKHIFAHKCYIYGFNQNETSSLLFDRNIHRNTEYTPTEKERLQAGIKQFYESLQTYLNDIDKALETNIRLNPSHEFLLKYNGLNLITAFDELYFFDLVFYENWADFEQIKNDHWEIVQLNDRLKERIQDYNRHFKIDKF